MATPLIEEWANATENELKQIEGVCLDIDDTLSTHGKLTAQAFEALWRLKKAGLFVVPITGRPAGWCDHIARFWPVDAVVGENGAFTFFLQDGKLKRYETPCEPSAEESKKKLIALKGVIAVHFPGVQFASDQNYREFDLAIDFCEDVPAWTQEEMDRLVALCEQSGAHAKVSSIHVNTWFGDYDKRKGFESFLSFQNKNEGKPFPAWERWLFIGDSPNDEPLFKSFKYSVGVSNLKKFLNRFKNPPRWLTIGESGEGFVEMADKMISIRKK